MPSLAIASSRNSSTDLPDALRTLRDQFLEPFGHGRAGMDDVDVDAVALAELRQAFGEIRPSPH